MGRIEKILDWYDHHRRYLPWRSAPGVVPNPYYVWLSEIMLQQTTVITVKPYFSYFLQKWPSIGNLADAPLDDILHAWQGLGYYARARNLHKCAKVIKYEYFGNFPENEKDLLKLPGIGPYTAAAIAAIAFGKIATPVDGNIERVICRLFSIKQPIAESKEKLRELASSMTPNFRAGDFAQSLMDIGATICIPKKPKCNLCPLTGECKANAEDIANDIPIRAPKRKKPTRTGVVFWLYNHQGEVLLRRRPDKGLLGGMIELPSSDWQDINQPVQNIYRNAPVDVDWQILPGKIKHTFTHFNLILDVAIGCCPQSESIEGIWSSPSNFSKYALPTVIKKVVSHALKYID